MGYHKKLREYFKDKGFDNIELAELFNYSPVMISRYLNSAVPNYKFINKVTESFPDIDWNYLFKESEGVNDNEKRYSKTPEVLLKEIKVRVIELEKWHKSDTEKK